MKFSIVIPTYNRKDVLSRAINSVLAQSFTDWELIIVDDGSTDGTKDFLEKIQDERIVKIYQENKGRISARNEGMKKAQGEWICWLDSDDAYLPTYLESLNKEIERNPDYPIFNFTSLEINKEIIDGKRYEKRSRIFPVFNLEEEKVGMKHFDKGNIKTGTFIFKRELSKMMGYMPEATFPYGDDKSFPAQLAKQDLIYKQICKKNEEGQWLPLGNPWGDDYVMFWTLTRQFKSKPLDLVLYIHYIR